MYLKPNCGLILEKKTLTVITKSKAAPPCSTCNPPQDMLIPIDWGQAGGEGCPGPCY